MKKITKNFTLEITKHNYKAFGISNRKSFLKYKSQVKKSPHPRSPEGILNLSRLRGSHINEEYCEAFKVERLID